MAGALECGMALEEQLVPKRPLETLSWVEPQLHITVTRCIYVCDN